MKYINNDFADKRWIWREYDRAVLIPGALRVSTAAIVALSFLIYFS